MTETELLILAAMILGAAALYTSVGHAGASGYLAAMAIMGLAPAVMKPTALALNILVASIATWRWTRGGRDLAWSALLPLVVASVPAAYAGGAIQLTDQQYRILLGVVLLVAAAKFLWQPKEPAGEAPNPIRIPWLGGLSAGAGVGLLSGLSGTGGGIFLTPLLILFGWAAPKQASGLTAPFILLNSVAALAGNLAAVESLPPELPVLVLAAVTGAIAGSHFGFRLASAATLQRLLGVVLLIAAGKFLLT